MKTATNNERGTEMSKQATLIEAGVFDNSSNMSDHGTVKHGDKTLVLTQEAYPTSGSFPVPGGATYTGCWYEAHAVDAGGTDYRVIWTDVDYESEACDWDDPDYVFEA